MTTLWKALRTHLAPLLLLLALNGLAHFIPFERAALSNDDLVRLVILPAREHLFSFLLKDLQYTTDRPLLILHYFLQMAAGERPQLAVLLVFLSSTLFIWTVYGLFHALMRHRRLALLCSFFYLLLPNKAALYHHLTVTYLNLMLALYAASFLLFVLFCQRGQRRWLAGSLICYTLGAFGYEAGFLLPLVLWAYTLLFAKEKGVYLRLFIVPVTLWLYFRLNFLGLFSSDPGSTAFVQYQQFTKNFFGALPHLYAGRQMAKTFIYGICRFFTLENPWLWVVLAADAVFVGGLLRWFKQVSFPAFSRRVLVLCAVLFVCFAVPPCLSAEIFERHTALPSIGLVPLLLAAMRLLPVRQTRLWAILLVPWLMAAQGNAWSQVVACRINRAVEETLKERREEILRSDLVVMDQYSFAKRIPYTWVSDPNNQLDTYWGVEALVEKSIPVLVHHAVGQPKETIVARNPLERKGEDWLFNRYNQDLYRQQETKVPVKGSFVVDYAMVYPRGFLNGNRSRPEPKE